MDLSMEDRLGIGPMCWRTSEHRTFEEPEDVLQESDPGWDEAVSSSETNQRSQTAQSLESVLTWCSWQPSHRRPCNFLTLALFFLGRRVTLFKKRQFYFTFCFFLVSGGFRGFRVVSRGFPGGFGGFRGVSGWGGATITSLALDPILDATLQHLLLDLTHTLDATL